MSRILLILALLIALPLVRLGATPFWTETEAKEAEAYALLHASGVDISNAAKWGNWGP